MMVVAMLSSVALLAPPLLPVRVEPLRVELADAESRAEIAARELSDALADRDQGEAALGRLKSDLANGGGWFTERAVRRQSGHVRELVERSIEAGARKRAADDELDSVRRRLRIALFEEASRLTEDADAAARAGRTSEAAAGFAKAAAALAEAGDIRSASLVSPWQGLDAEMPMTGQETTAELDAIAAAYRDVVERIDQILGTLAPQLAALSDAGSTWERLSRFRSVVDRAGPSADPRPALAALRREVEHGEALRARAAANAERVDALRARVDAGGRNRGAAPHPQEAP